MDHSMYICVRWTSWRAEIVWCSHWKKSWECRRDRHSVCCCRRRSQSGIMGVRRERWRRLLGKTQTLSIIRFVLFCNHKWLIKSFYVIRNKTLIRAGLTWQRAFSCMLNFTPSLTKVCLSIYRTWMRGISGGFSWRSLSSRQSSGN